MLAEISQNGFSNASQSLQKHHKMDFLTHLMARRNITKWVTVGQDVVEIVPTLEYLITCQYAYDTYQLILVCSPGLSTI